MTIDGPCRGKQRPLKSRLVRLLLTIGFLQFILFGARRDNNVASDDEILIEKAVALHSNATVFNEAIAFHPSSTIVRSNTTNGKNETIAGNRNAKIDDSLPCLPVGSSLIPDDEHVVNVIEYQGNTRVQELAHEMMTGKFCNRAFQVPEIRSRTLVNVTFGCMSLFNGSAMGTGNYIAAFYGLRMAAHALGNVDLSIQCNDADATKKDLVLPWLTGFFPGVRHSIPLLDRTNPSVAESCTHYNKISLGYKIQSIRYELRRMALALVGLPSPSHASAKFASHYFAPTVAPVPDGSVLQLLSPESIIPPLYPDTELDDAVLHFRCGDLIDAKHPSFGFMKFRSFSRHISAEARSIGIITQPFDADGHQQRPMEQVQLKLDRCRLVVSELVNHLKEHFPHARITIRNDKTETIALAFARMVMANQTVVPISTFSIMPALATFGKSYIRKPDYAKAPNQFLLHPNIEELTDNVFLVEEARLMAKEVKEMWGEDGTAVLDWFRGDP